MMKRPALLAAPLVATLAALALAACTPTSKVAEPDIVMKSPVMPDVLAPCLAMRLGQQFRDHRPKLVEYRQIHEITVDSQRGEKLAFVTIEPDWAQGSIVSFYDGDLYWPNHTSSGVWPDVMRDNWHRFEAAENACQPTAMAAKPARRVEPAPPPAAAPVRAVTQTTPLKPLKGPAPAVPGAPRPLTP
ncbi:MAG: hypothetical protein ACREEP_08040 [Dongiaceae bacterium]